MKDFRSTLDDIEALAMEAIDQGMKLILVGDFNVSIGEISAREQVFQDLIQQLDLQIINTSGIQSDARQWTHRSAAGSYRRIDFVMSSSALAHYGGYAIDSLNLGSDHRAVQARIRIRHRFDRSQLRRKNFKGWLPHLDAQGMASSYQDHLDRMMLECGFDSLAQLSEACLRAAPLGGSTDSGPNRLRRPEKSPEVRKLIVERKACRDPVLRQALSKSITKAMKKELRVWNR